MISVLPTDSPNTAPGSDSSLPHVLLVLDQFPKALGGGERIVLKLAALLPQYGYRASILTFSIHPECTTLQSPPCPIYLLPLRRTYDVQAFQAALEFRQFIRKNNVKIVQTFFESSDIWAGMVTKTVPPTKLIWSRRDMGILRTGKHRLAYRLMAGAPDAVFAVSEQVRRHCIEIDKIDQMRVSTVYNGLDLAAWDRTSPVGGNSRKIHVTTAGNIRRVKGHDIFVRAAASVVNRFPETTFSIAGEVLDPHYFEELQALIAELKLGHHFFFAGGVANLKEYLSSADIFVLPSRSEGFSNAIIEAMAASLPVVATDVGGNAEAVKEGQSGFIVPPEDPEALAAAISRLLADMPLAAAMGIVGKMIVSEHFTTEAMMKQITGTYNKLLSAK